MAYDDNHGGVRMVEDLLPDFFGESRVVSDQSNADSLYERDPEVYFFMNGICQQLGFELTTEDPRQQVFLKHLHVMVQARLFGNTQDS